jgi:hypothetical protein
MLHHLLETPGCTPRVLLLAHLPAGRRCGGGWSDEALNYAFAYNISTEAAYPYKGVTNPCNSTALRVGRHRMAWHGAWRGCPPVATFCAGGIIRQQILS